MVAYVHCCRSAGSLTASPGYENGVDLGIGELRRRDGKTLRWSDCELFRINETNGIALTLHLKYIQNQRDPNTSRKIPAQKRFTFLPPKGNRFELDVSAIFTALAYSRGLLEYSSLEALHAGKEKFLKLDPIVKDQAIFVGAGTNSGDIRPDSHMKLTGTKKRLQEKCKLVGIMSYYTKYSWRRTVNIELRREQGTETAKNLAEHTQQSDTIASYDTFGLADWDVTAVRLGEDGETRDKLCTLFTPGMLARMAPSTAADAAETPSGLRGNLQVELETRVLEKIRKYSKYFAIENELPLFSRSSRRSCVYNLCLWGPVTSKHIARNSTPPVRKTA